MKRKTITFLADYPNWAFDFIAKSISFRLSYKYKFVTQYSSRKPILDPQTTDLLYVFFWGESWYKRFDFAPGQIIKEVASFRWKNESHFGLLSAKDFAITYLTDCGLVTTPARCLYDELSPYVAELYLCPNGVEERLFMRRRAGPLSGPLKIGWVGNPSDEGKGLYDILIPATAGYEFFYTSGDLTREQLVKFYRNIDVLAIASKAESQPLPLLEGLASGCLPVTTSVGIVPEVIENREIGLVVNRTVEGFRHAFQWCESNLEQVRAHRLDRAEIASRQSWDIWAYRFADIFDLAISRNRLDETTRGRLPKRIDRKAWVREKRPFLLPSLWKRISARLVMIIWDRWTLLAYGSRLRQSVLGQVKSTLLRIRQ
jgi:hypothetical protein